MIGDWKEVDFYGIWSDRPENKGATEVVKLFLDRKQNAALAMIANDPTCVFKTCELGSSVEGNSCLHVLAHRGQKEFDDYKVFVVRAVFPHGRSVHQTPLRTKRREHMSIRRRTYVGTYVVRSAWYAVVPTALPK